MSEFLTGLSYLSATVVGAAGVSFGLVAGLHLATKAFGPIQVNFKHGDINVQINNTALDSRSERKGEGG